MNHWIALRDLGAHLFAPQHYETFLFSSQLSEKGSQKACPNSAAQSQQNNVHNFASELEKFVGLSAASAVINPVITRYAQFWQQLPLFKFYWQLARVNTNSVPVTRSYQDPNDMKQYKVPTGLTLITLEHSDGSVCKTVIYNGHTPLPRGSQVGGSLEGRRVKADKIPADTLMQKRRPIWEVMKGVQVDHFMDLSFPGSNWTRFVRSARYLGGPVSNEYNLELSQRGNELYFIARHNIQPGEQLMAWYGDNYNIVMGVVVGLKPILPSAQIEGERTRLEKTDQFAIKRLRIQTNLSSRKLLAKNPDFCPVAKLPKLTPTEIQTPVMVPSISPTASAAGEGEGYPCGRCGKVFAYQYYRDKHLKYTRCIDRGDRKFPCSLCTRSFEKRDRLRIHVLHVHEKHRPHKCAVCGKTFSQSSSLNKHFRVHSGERPYKCVFCCKSFTASSILRTHTRQHSGEKPFKCRFCPKSFASHAAHDSHVRRTHPEESLLECLKCGLKLESRRLLNMHITISHK